MIASRNGQNAIGFGSKSKPSRDARRRRFTTKSQADLQGDFQQSQADYRAAKRSSRFQIKRGGIPSMGASADWHYKNDSQYLWMSEVARDIDRNDVVAGQILDRVVDNEVQDGFKLNCLTGDPKLDRDLEQRWSEEAADPQLCDVTGMRTFHDQERLVAREEKLVGDIFPIPVTDPENGIRGAVQLVENYRCRSPHRTKRTIVSGIELDPFRRPLRYFFTKDAIDPRSQVRMKDLDSIEANGKPDGLTGFVFPNVWHVMRQKRPSQTRGITAFAPLFDVVGIHDDLQYSKLVQQQINSFFCFLRTRGVNWEEPDADVGNDSVSGISSTTGSLGENQEELVPGMELAGERDERIEGWSPNIPNQEWFQHVKLLLTFVGINLGAPLVMVLMDAGETNFSGYRGAIDQARLQFRCNQRNRVARFYRPYFRWRLRTWLDDDETLRRRFLSNRKKVNLFRHEWGPPRWPYIEPLKDAMAAAFRGTNNLESQRNVVAETGGDIDTNMRHNVEDNGNGIQMAIEKANEINTVNGLSGDLAVSWQQIWQPPMPQGVTLQLNAAGDVSEQPARGSDGTPSEG